MRHGCQVVHQGPAASHCVDADKLADADASSDGLGQHASRRKCRQQVCPIQQLQPNALHCIPAHVRQ